MVAVAADAAAVHQVPRREVALEGRRLGRRVSKAVADVLGSSVSAATW